MREERRFGEKEFWFRDTLELTLRRSGLISC